MVLLLIRFTDATCLLSPSRTSALRIKRCNDIIQPYYPTPKSDSMKNGLDSDWVHHSAGATLWPFRHDYSWDSSRAMVINVTLCRSPELVNQNGNFSEPPKRLCQVGYTLSPAAINLEFIWNCEPP
jgi:hypothetical protein